MESKGNEKYYKLGGKKWSNLSLISLLTRLTKKKKMTFTNNEKAIPFH